MWSSMYVERFVAFIIITLNMEWYLPKVPGCLGTVLVLYHDPYRFKLLCFHHRH